MRGPGPAVLGGVLLLVLAGPVVTAPVGSAAPATSAADEVVVGPPPVDPALRPADAPPAPLVPTERTGPCTVTSAPSTGELPAQPWAQRQLAFTDAWPFGRGGGQVVAVIDTGVTPGPRLRVEAGGDYVSTDGDGTTDCDVHGSIVASIIAAQPSSADPTGYAGVAPDARLISIRQYSAAYRPVRTTPGAAEATSYGNVATLARAVVHAADLGATVINISEAACGPAGEVLRGDDVLGAALQYAVDTRDAVVVAAAGNVDTQGGCQVQNDPTAVPPVVATVASPAWYDDDVLAVGSVGQDGNPSDFSLAGSWVDVAAPGTGIVALNPAPGGAPLIDQVSTDGAPSPVQGTSFAAPYVAGTVALVRARHPELSARQVMARVEATAHAPAGGWNPQVGHGVIDPVAAVTAVLPADVEPQVAAASTGVLAAPALPAAPDTTPRTVALVGSVAALVSAVVTFGVLDAVRRARRRRS